MVGDYQLVESLGEGGLGEAFLAKHTQTGAPAVVKLLHPERVGSADAMQSYFDELRAVASLQHPGIVAVLDCGMHGDQPYVVTEEVDGEALDVELEEHALLTPVRTLAACKQIAEALSAVHAAGLIHGDLTSANVIISGDAFRVFDFGSRHLPPPEDPSVYLAPEQYGDGLVGPHSDIYSLGILMYEMLTARVPFGDANEEEAKAGHLGELPAPPSQIVRNMPPHVEAVCLKALEKDPDNRYASMDELASALADPQGYVEANGGLAGFLSGGSRLVLPGAPAEQPAAVPAPVPLAKTMLGIAAIEQPAAPVHDGPTEPVAAPEPEPAPAPAPAPAPTPATAAPTAQTMMAAPAVRQPIRPDAQPVPQPQPQPQPRPQPQAAPAMARADITDELAFPPKSRAPLIAAAVGAVVIVVGLIVVLSGGDDGDDEKADTDQSAGTVEPAVAAESVQPAPSIDATPAVAPAPVVPDAAPAAPPEPTMVVLSVETDPAGAEVFVEGESKSRGRAPVRVELEQGSSATLIARKRGHEDARKTVTADDHATVSLELESKRVATKPDRSDREPKKERKRRSKRKKRKHGRDDLLPPKL